MLPTLSPGSASSQPKAQPGRHQWYSLVLLTLIYAVNNLDRNVIFVIQEPIKQEFNLSDGQLGLLGGFAFGVTYAICAIPIGMLSDRVNRRNLLAACMAIWSVATALAAFTRSFGALVVSRLVVAAAESGATPASTSMISDLFPPNRRATAVGIFFTGPAIGASISFLFGGMIAHAYGWRAALIIASAPGLVLTALLLLTFRHPTRGAMDPSAAKAEPPRGIEVIQRIAGDPALCLIFTGVTSASMAGASFGAWAMSLLVRQHGLALDTAGAAVALCLGIIPAVGLAVFGPLSDRLSAGSPRRLLIFSATTVLLSCVTLFFCIQSGSIAAALVGMAAYGAVSLAFLGPSFSVVLNQLEPYYRGVTVALLQVCVSFLGAGTGPLVVGALSDLHHAPGGLRWALLMTSPAAFLLSSLLFFIAARRTPR